MQDYIPHHVYKNYITYYLLFIRLFDGFGVIGDVNLPVKLKSFTGEYRIVKGI